MEKPDPYGEWVLQKVQQETGGNKAPIPEEVLAAARATWPRIVIHATREFERQGSTREAVALAADIWEAVLRSVAKAFLRKGGYASSIEDLESYLLTAFHHRFHRFLKAEQERHEIFQSVSGPLNLDLLETTQNAEWVSQLERKIAVRQVTDRMDGWTKKVWQARQIRLFMERDLDLARDHGTPSEDEVPVRSGKDTRKLTSITESSVGEKVRLRSIGCIFAQ